MTDPRWSRIEDLFAEAADIADEGARARFLDAACGGDAAVREEVEALLAATPDAAAFFGGLRDGVLRASTTGVLGGGTVDEAIEEAVEGALARTRGGAEGEAGLDGPDAMLGQRVGPWRLVRVLGHGGMGAVYHAERAEGDFAQRAALKLVRPGLRAVALARFHAERRILSRLEHPHIARLLDGGVAADGRPYLAMEYVEGEPITAYCDNRRLSVNERLVLFEQVCAAVAYAHRQLVVHRDLKPGNVYVTTEGQVKLLDFGIAKLLTEDEAALTLTQDGAAPHTPAYAAPEQIRGEAVTTATDVYALGVLLYELLTGHRPYRFPSRFRQAVEQAILDAAPDRPSTVVLQAASRTRPDGTAEALDPGALSAARCTEPARLRRRLAGDLDRMVLKALRKEPERRYGSAEAFGRDVERHLAGLPVEARADTVGYRAAKFFRRHRAGVVAGALGLLALLAAAGVALWQAGRAEREAATARAEARKAVEVTRFVVDLFRAPDPSIEAVDPDTLTARHLLARGLERAGALDGEPATQAALLHAIALTYENLGLPGEALGAAERTVALRRSGDDEADLAWALLTLGSVHAARTDFDDAEAAFREAIALAERPGMSPLLLASALNRLAMMEALRANLAAAEPLYRQALALFRRTEGPGSDEVATILHNLGSLHHHLWRLDEAVGLFEESIAIRRRQAPGPDRTLGLGSSLTLLAHALRDAGRPAEAEAAAREALTVLWDRLPAEHDRLMDAQTALGGALVLQGRYAEALPLLREATAVRERQWGADHWRAATPQAWLGAAYTGTGRFPEAERLLLRALGTVVALRGPDDVYAARIREGLVRLYQAWGKPERAALYRAAG